MSNKQFLALPVTGDTFAEVREKNRYYVDKTPYLKQVFSEDEAVDENSLIDGTTVLLLTRPRRFGKTMLMNMFESFLNINYEKPGDTSIQDKFFKGTKILEDQKFCKKYMGQFPVISITLKDVLGDSYEDAYFQLAGIVADKVNEYGFLKDSPALNDDDKDTFSKLSNKDFLIKSSAQTRYYITKAIASLSLMLYKHFNKQVYILIDEYDVPLAKAHAKGFHEKMVNLMSSFLGFLKDPQKDPLKKTSIISKVVLTGCLKVAKNSIFTGVNNLYVNTVADQETEYTGIIGFTKDETQKILKDYELDDFSQAVKNYYDGYKFYDKEMFCPWDVISFIRKNFNFKQTGNTDDIKPGNYWDKSSSDSALGEYLGYLTDNDNQKMQNLVNGKSISFQLNDSMNYDTLSEHKSDDFWSLLLHTGYLTVDWVQTQKEELAKENNKDIFVRIPNLEILECFENNILDRFGKILSKDNLALNIANALLEGKVDYVQDKLGPLLRSFVSVRDTATKAPHENYYHGFLNGIFTNCKDNLGEYHSNYESGDGYADITFNNLDGTKACVIEIKVCKEKESRAKKANEAIEQILEKRYADTIFEDENITCVNAVGIAFSGKNCFISVKKLK
ncbi:MAG: AAA family ATPase [Succinivibrio sp.]|nr:AAA family ATPase [Succinivibrio sp.]